MNISKKYALGVPSVLVVVLGLVLAVAQPASAMSAVYVDSPAKVEVNGARVRVPVTVSCTAGETAFISVGLTQRVGNGIANGYGYANNVSCTGSSQTVEVFVTANNKPFKKGQAAASFDLSVCNGFSCEFLNHQQTIVLTKD